ncbi:hypothetical protein NESM_000357600 [Novymonas esmeraldas]|uniref:Uncharacterized protein n=1 Tax=Novymonas esmeraldas TaxID=1808958 RepID=A0AAW0EJS0_9TRYP
MESVNLTALFRSQLHESDFSDGASATTASSNTSAKAETPQEGVELPAASVSPAVEESDNPQTPPHPQRSLHHQRHGDSASTGRRRDNHGSAADAASAALLGDGEEVPERRPLDGRSDPASDTTSLRAYWHALFSPQVYMPVFYALRITLLVALPLGLLARHPSVMLIFPAHVVLPLWGVVDCRYTFGEQLAANVVSLQCGVWMMLWGVLCNSWGLLHHPSGWWCSVLGVVFAISLLGDVRARRVLVLHSVLIMQMENLPGGTELIYPAKVGRDIMIATGFAFFQCLLPLRSIAVDCDAEIAAGWKSMGVLVRQAVTACWSEDPIECALAMAHLTTEPIQLLLMTMPGKLFFVMYEFWESTLRLELRRERLSVLEVCVPRLHAITDTARAMVMTRVHHMGYQRHRIQAAADRPGSDGDSRAHQPYGEDAGTHAPFGKDAAGTKPWPAREAGGVRAARHSGHHDGADASLSLDWHTRMWRRAHAILRPSVDHYLEALDAVLAGLGRHLDPQDTVEHVPFDALREAAAELQARLNQVHFELLIKSEDSVDPFLYSNVFFFHLSLIVLGERLLHYGDTMKNFDRRRYKSQLRRLWEFFFYDYWVGFWQELPRRLTLATPRDVRIFKDAIKMSCAYGVGVMFTEYMDTENVYYFGMAILMGVGWPTAGDTMEASVYRVTGMVCACSIAYVAIWHTPNLLSELAIALAGVFIALIFRDRPPYSHTAQYCSMLIVTSLNSAGSKFVLLSRIVSNSFTVMTYYAIVTLMFPIDVLRVTYNAQVAGLSLVADRFSRLVDVMNEPLSSPDATKQELVREEVASIRGSRFAMWAAVNAIGGWLPKAAAEPAPIGSPYPLREMRDMYSSLRRLASATDVISAAVGALHRDGAPEHRPDVQHVLSAVAPVMCMVDRVSRLLFQDFLDAVSQPHVWSPVTTTQHFSAFLSLSKELHHSFTMAHRRHVKALRSDFRHRVMSRTFAAAAHARVLDEDTLNRVRSASVPLHQSSGAGAHGGGGGCGGGVGASRTSFAAASEDLEATIVVVPPQDGSPRRQSTWTAEDASGPLGDGEVRRRGGDDDDNANRPDTGDSVTNRSIARSIAESIAIMRSTQRRHSRLQQQRSQSAGSGGSSSGLLAVPASPTSASSHSDEAALQAQETQHWEHALDPLEQQAQEEEYRDFVAHRALDYTHHTGEYTLSHDINMVITILVGTDMFFGEAERLLKTMYAINAYARSREPPPMEPTRAKSN